MTKCELLKELDGSFNLAQGCFMFSYIVGAVPWRDHVKTFVGPCIIDITSNKNKHRLEFEPSQLLKRYEHPNSVRDDGLNITRLGLSTAIRESYEAIKAFCKSTDQMEVFRAFHWYHFVKVVRNSFSHNFHIDFSLQLTKADKKAGLKEKWLQPQTLQFSSGSVTLEMTLHGKELDFDILPIACAFDLLRMVRASVEEKFVG